MSDNKIADLFYSSYTALDITGTDIRAVMVKGGRARIWGSAELPEGLVRTGTILEPRTVSVIISDLFRELKLPRKRVICTVTGLPFIYRTITLPTAGRKTPVEAIEREARREMSLSEEDMYLSWQTAETHPESQETDYFVLGVPRASFNPLVETLNLAGIKPTAVDIKPLALARAAGVGDAIIVSLEKDYFDIVLAAQGRMRVLHSVTPRARSQDITGIIHEVVDGLNKAVKSFGRDFPQNTLEDETPILLTGALAADEQMVELVRNTTGRPASFLPPPLEAPPEMPPGLYTAALGLALKKERGKNGAAGYSDIDINLLLGMKKPRALKLRKPYAVAAVICVLLALLVYQTYDMKAGANAELAELQKESTRIASQIKDAQKASKEALAAKEAASQKLESAAAELEALRGEYKTILERKFDYSARIVSIANAYPVDAGFDSLNMDPARIQVTGTAESPFAILTASGNLEYHRFFSSARIVQIGNGQEEGYTYSLAIDNNAGE